jgi:flagellar protein FlaJ
MKIKKTHWFGILIGIIIIAVSVIFFYKEKIFWLLISIGVVAGGMPFVISTVRESEDDKKKEEMFLEFARNLVENVKSGTPISKSIINVQGKDYGVLTPYIDKLANQIALGIPVRQALEIFAAGTRSKGIIRAVDIIRQAENAGGSIESILDSVAKSVSETEKLKKERRVVVYEMVSQGYIIFFIFIFIMLIMQFKIIPMTAGVASFSGNNNKIDASTMSLPFLVLLIVQGLFIGLVIGKLSEGSIKAGVKHSFILMVLAVLISSGARAFF